jgi:hypothetical protein
MLAVQPMARRFEATDRDLQRIAGLGTFDIDRAGDGIDLAEIERVQRLERGIRPSWPPDESRHSKWMVSPGLATTAGVKSLFQPKLCWAR